MWPCISVQRLHYLKLRGDSLLISFDISVWSVRIWIQRLLLPAYRDVTGSVSIWEQWFSDFFELPLPCLAFIASHIYIHPQKKNTRTHMHFSHLVLVPPLLFLFPYHPSSPPPPIFRVFEGGGGKYFNHCFSSLFNALFPIQEVSVSWFLGWESTYRIVHQNELKEYITLKYGCEVPQQN